MSDFEIRPVSEHDAEEIARLDEHLTGQWRIEHWEERIAYAARRDPDASLVALADSRLIAYLFTDTRGQEYGFEEKTGWIEAIGVDPEYQKQTVGRHLVERVLHRFQQTGVNHIRTLVSAHQSQLESFFAHLGFEAEPIKVLRLTIPPDGGEKE